MRRIILTSILVLSVIANSQAGQLTAEMIEPMSVAHENGGVEVHNGQVYVWSGYTNSGSPRTDVLEVYDPTANTWTTREPVTGARNGLGNFSLNGKLYSIGGEMSPSGFFSNTVYRYDTASDSWSTMNAFPTSICDSATVTCDGTGYSIGGRHGYGQTYAHTYAYDEAADSWQQKTDMLYSVMGASSICYADKIWIFGGNHKIDEATNEFTDKVQVYDPALNSWSYGIDIPVTLSNSKAVVYQDSAWIFSNTAYDEQSETWIDNEYAYEFDFLTEQWHSYQFIPPVNTNFCSDLALIGDYVYFTNTYNSIGEPSTAAYRVMVPEPACILLLGLGGFVIRKKTHRRA
jgi:N-acetylneuraminic acid mutarotase